MIRASRTYKEKGQDSSGSCSDARVDAEFQVEVAAIHLNSGIRACLVPRQVTAEQQRALRHQHVRRQFPSPVAFLIERC